MEKRSARATELLDEVTTLLDEIEQLAQSREVIIQERDQARASNAAMKQALEAVQWIAPSQAWQRREGDRYCPKCGAHEGLHAGDCPIALALGFHKKGTDAGATILAVAQAAEKDIMGYCAIPGRQTKWPGGPECCECRYIRACKALAAWHKGG
jgi:hypothetical protein